MNILVDTCKKFRVQASDKFQAFYSLYIYKLTGDWWVDEEHQNPSNTLWFLIIFLIRSRFLIMNTKLEINKWEKKENSGAQIIEAERDGGGCSADQCGCETTGGGSRPANITTQLSPLSLSFFANWQKPTFSSSYACHPMPLHCIAHTHTLAIQLKQRNLNPRINN